MLEVTLGTVFIVLGLTSSIFLLHLLRTYNQGLVNQTLGVSLAHLRMDEIHWLSKESSISDPRNAQIPIAEYSNVHPDSQVGDPSAGFHNFFMNTQLQDTPGNADQRILTVWVFFPGVLGGQTSYALSTIYKQ